MIKMINNLLELASKISKKEFVVRDFNINDIETNMRFLSLTEITQMLTVIPNDKFELHVKQIKE